MGDGGAHPRPFPPINVGHVSSDRVFSQTKATKQRANSTKYSTVLCLFEFLVLVYQGSLLWTQEWLTEHNKPAGQGRKLGWLATTLALMPVRWSLANGPSNSEGMVTYLRTVSRWSATEFGTSQRRSWYIIHSLQYSFLPRCATHACMLLHTSWDSQSRAFNMTVQPQSKWKQKKM